jgi:uncharacterized membrane protein ArfB
MDFVIQWLWYLAAFVAGSGVAWAIASVLNKRVSNEAVSSDSTGRAVGERR